MTDTETTTALAPLDETYNLVIAEIEQTQPMAGRVRFTRQGLELPPDLSYDECTQATQYISGRIRRDAVDANLMQLCLGDIIQYAESRWGDTYSQFLDATGLAYGTLANAAYVARKVALSSRNETLSFAHHLVVAPLPPDQQHEWLQKAAEQEWGGNELRRQVQASKDIDAGRDPDQAEIERELQRIAGRMADTLPDSAWPVAILHGLLIPLTAATRTDRCAIDFLGDLNESSQALRATRAGNA